jgi:hypothetical protein
LPLFNQPPSDAIVRLLESPECPACRARDYADERLVFAFVTDHYSEAATLDAIAASWGPCPVHLRQILEQDQAPYVLRAVYAATVAQALAAPAGAIALCPLCRECQRSEYSTLRAVTSALQVPAVRESYTSHGGFCTPHARGAVVSASRDAVTCILSTLIASLEARVTAAALVTALAGADRDAPRRHALRRRLPLERLDGPPLDTLERLQRQLAAALCPVCLAESVAQRTYLCWLIAQQRKDPDGLAAEALWLCPLHLHDLLEESSTTADWIAKLMRIHLSADLENAHDSVARAPLLFRGLQRRLEPVLHERCCLVCDAGSARAASERALLAATLHDAPTARRYETVHGLCARHGRGFPDTTGLARRVLDARLRVLHWELEEAGRKSSWTMRHEPRGPESTAWRRAPAQLDGRVYLGGPA